MFHYNGSMNWNDKSRLIAAVDGAVSMREILNSLGLRPSGGNYRSLKRWCRIHEIALPMWDISAHNRQTKAIPLEEILTADSNYRNSNYLGRRLVSAGLLDYLCICGIGDTWLGKPITLHLDHIDGDWTNNQLSNLRFLCPNCHSQTETWGNKRRR